MRSSVTLGMLLAVLALPLTAAAQSAPGPERRPLEIRRSEVPPSVKGRRLMVRPDVAPDEVARGADRDVAAFDQNQRDEKLLREQGRRQPQRLGLDGDVVCGIQQRSIQKALPR